MDGPYPAGPVGGVPDRPSPARVYDWFLGGSYNFPVDRALGAEAAALLPELPQMLRANRAFLQRAVQYVAGCGVSQFVDLGSGLPTVGNVHTAARAIAPGARVVYVDVDPAVAHGPRRSWAPTRIPVWPVRTCWTSTPCWAAPPCDG